MKKLLFGLVLTLSQAALAGAYCEVDRHRSAAEQLADFDLNVELNVVDLDLFEGGTAVAGYEYEVEPAYTNGLYARTDRWKLGTDLVPQTVKQLTDELKSTLGLGARFKSEATFVRFFGNACDAETARPYSPRRIPLKSEVALSDKFRVGDYFIYKSELGFVVGLDLLKLLGTPSWAASSNTSYLVEGGYQVHLVRVDDHHVRLKVLARRKKEGSLALGLGWNGSFKVFGVSALDKELKRQVNPEPLKVTVKDTKAQVFLIDYVLDLRDPAVADAFNKVARKALSLEQLRLAIPLRNERTLTSELVLDLAPLEDIYRADYQQNSVGRLKRNLRTSSDQSGRSLTLDLGNKLMGLEFDATASVSRMSVRTPADALERYLLKSYDRTFDGHFAWSLSRLYSKRSVEVLLRADESFTQLGIMNIAQTLETRDKRLARHEFDQIQLSLKKALPMDIYQQVPFQTWTQTRDQLVRNFGLRYQVVLGPEVVLATTGMQAVEIAALFRDYIASKGLGAADFYYSVQDSGEGSEELYERSLRAISEGLAVAANTRVSDLVRLEAFMALRSNTLFQQTGIGFLLSLPAASRNYRIDLNLSGNGQQIDFSKGDESVAHFYRQLLTVKAALEDDGLDLRREAESLFVR